MAKTKQTRAVQERDNLTLIPPLAEDFSLYGGSGTVERARRWALAWRHLLADGVPACAHGLYLMASCPAGTCHTHFRQLDHARLWVPADLLAGGRPFLLCHPYSSHIAEDTRTYANAHGLVVSTVPVDGWYADGALPIRLTIPENWPLWPIEATAAVLLSTQPMAWPSSPARLPRPQHARETAR